MSEKPEVWRAIDSLIWPHIAAKLVRRQHAEIERLRDELKEDTGVIAVWRGRTERAESENERLRGLLTEVRGAKWLVVQDNLLDRIDAALRGEET